MAFRNFVTIDGVAVPMEDLPEEELQRLRIMWIKRIADNLGLDVKIEPEEKKKKA